MRSLVFAAAIAVAAVVVSTDALGATNYEAPTHGYGPLAVNPDDSWSGSFAEPNDGWWTFDFISPSTNATRLPNQDASCKIRIG